jgi:protein tyrosine/serine phosphatase
VRRWIDLEGLANLRDLGGLPTDSGDVVRPRRLLRSDNLQALTPGDIETLIELGLSDVIDLRSEYEADAEGPGPLLLDPRVAIHQHSFFREWREGVGEEKPEDRPEIMPEEALPWVDLEPSVELANPVSSIYLSYVLDRPDSVLAALREISAAPGAALVHCAAGKDRTGTLVSMALTLVGVQREAIIEDYAASTERVEAVVGRLLASPTYAENLRDRPMESHVSYPETMRIFLEHVDEQYGGVSGLVERIGWTRGDTERLRTHLLAPRSGFR